jgi:hypothetical protein
MSIEPRGGPPTNDEAQAGQDLGDIEETGSHTDKRRLYRRRGGLTLRHAPQDTHSQLERRREAKNRSVPLGCRCRDPLTCRCHVTEPPLSDHALDGWRDAALRVLSDGHLPLTPIEVRRALWKRGPGPDRALAERLHEACGGQVT